MLLRRPAEPPQRVLQSLRQCHIALATEHHMGMLVTGEYEPEVIEPMAQHDARDRNAKLTRIGEVRQTKMAGRMLLAKDHITLGPCKRSPCAHASLQRASNVGGDLGMAATDFFQHRNGSDAGCRL